MYTAIYNRGIELLGEVLGQPDYRWKSRQVLTPERVDHRITGVPGTWALQVHGVQPDIYVLYFTVKDKEIDELLLVRKASFTSPSQTIWSKDESTTK